MWWTNEVNEKCISAQNQWCKNVCKGSSVNMWSLNSQSEFVLKAQASRSTQQEISTIKVAMVYKNRNCPKWHARLGHKKLWNLETNRKRLTG